MSALRSCMVLTTWRSLSGVVGDLVPGQRLGDHAGGPSARGQRGVGDHAHQPDRGAAVDEPDAALGQPPCRIARAASVKRVGARARAAEDAERLDGRHAGLPSGTGICGRRTAAGRRTRRTMVSAASLSWMVEREGGGGQGEDRRGEEGETVARDVGRRRARRCRASSPR